ncbi:MAG: TAXI family TRAP transporter solute-binding subunit [Thermodesulfobacteriota bacterium]
MRKTMAVLAGCLLILGLVSAAAAQETKMVLATGGTAGTYYPLGGAMVKIWNSKIQGLNVTSQATGASVENVRLVNREEAELAIVQSDTIDFAFNAKETFKEKLTKMTALAVLYPEIIQLVVRGDSPAKTFADLKGLKVGVGAPGSGTEANFRQLLDIYGLKKEEVKAQYLSFGESAEQFKERRLDAFIVAAGLPNSAILDISAMQSIKLLNISDDLAIRLIQKHPFLAQAKVPANTYKGQMEEVKTLAVMAVLIASPTVKDVMAYYLVKTLFENQNDLAQAHAKGKELSLQTATKSVSIPFHPGAVKYYKEKGVMK